jgi:hypothetical protein
MKLDPKQPPRRFRVGIADLELRHVADIDLEPDEMVTLTSESGHEYDLTRKDWGYYATPSLGGRLRRHGLRAVLMRNVDTRQCFVVLVEDGKEAAWRAYNAAERQEVVLWLDEFDTLAALPAQEPWREPAHD